jgi:DNA invertase Pin-like site-specific DNA recombinase
VVLDGYIRVSRVGKRKGPRFISVKVQREQIERWAALHGVSLGKVFVELNQSGARADRPRLTRALERVETGESDGIIVARLDRFGRSLKAGLAAIEQIEKAGGTFVSVQEGFDLATPTGRLMLRIMLSMAEWELDRLRESWAIARLKALDRGAFMYGTPPIGYRRGDDDRLEPEPYVAETIAEVFRRRAASASAPELAKFLNDSGIRSRAGKAFSASAVERILASRTYLGETSFMGQRNPDAHQPIVDQATWQLAQFPRQRARRSARGFLTGILRCAGCGGPMGPQRPKTSASESAVYRCSPRAKTSCPAPAAARADEIEPLVETLLFKLARRRSSGSQLVIGNREAELAAAEGDLAAYRDNLHLQRTLGERSFEAGIASRQRHVERALRELVRARRAAHTPDLQASQLEERWAELEAKERREFLPEYLDAIFIERGSRPAHKRAWVCRLGEGPPDLDSAGSPGPFDPAAVHARRLRLPKRWSPERLQAELRAFLGERTEWPQYPAFARAGCARLHLQMMLWGGPYFWARRLGLRLAPRSVVWNELRMIGALRALLHGRKQWPAKRDFNQAGLASLYDALAHRGGLAYWARQFGFEVGDYWSSARIAYDLRRFLEDRTRFPTKAEFAASHRLSLYLAARQNGGIPYWARRLALPPEVKAPVAVSPGGSDLIGLIAADR